MFHTLENDSKGTSGILFWKGKHSRFCRSDSNEKIKLPCYILKTSLCNFAFVNKNKNRYVDKFREVGEVGEVGVVHLA